MRTFRTLFVLLAISTGCSWRSMAQSLEPVSTPPAFGTFFLASGGPPFPFDPALGQLPVYEWRPMVYVVDDSGGAWASGAQSLMFDEGGGASTMSLPSPCSPCPTNGSGGGGPAEWGGPAYDHSPTNLWLEILSATASNSTALLVIHTPETNGVYDLFSTTNMAPAAAGLNQTNWIWLMRTAAGQTNLTLTNIWPLEGWFQLGTMLDGDADGLTTAFESLSSHTLIADPDTDDDGIWDGVEVQYLLNPRVADPPFTITISNPSPLLP